MPQGEGRFWWWVVCCTTVLLFPSSLAAVLRFRQLRPGAFFFSSASSHLRSSSSASAARRTSSTRAAPFLLLLRRSPLVSAPSSPAAVPTTTTTTTAFSPSGSARLLVAMTASTASTEGKTMNAAGGVPEGTASAASPPSSSARRTLETFHFDNAAIRTLPMDPETRNYVRQVPNAVYSRVKPEPVRNPAVVAVAEDVMTGLLELDPSELSRPELAEAFAGNVVLPGSETYSHCYCGHQFGFFSGQLGDGAAIALGEVVNSQGERWELQLKGAGPTPYSRRADGRKVLRSSIREFLCSEAMHALGIPTTRAGTVITSDTLTQRDVFYTGNVINERCTVVLRLAPTFFRFGSFETTRGKDPQTGRAGASAGNAQLLRQMLHYVIDTFFPHITAKDEASKFLSWYEEAAVLTARLVAKWQAVGFTHGVLNTDNMSVLGLTIDYGPYGFMEWFDPDYIPNGSDNGGRYAYSQQPEICRWNIETLGETLSLVLPLDQPTKEGVLRRYDEEYDRAYMGEIRAKLGLTKRQEEGDAQLIKELFSTMHATSADFTKTFLTLANDDDGPSSTDSSTRGEKLAEALAGVSATPQNLIGSLSRQRRIVAPKMPHPQIKALWEVVEKAPEQLSQLFHGPTDMIVAEIKGEMDKLTKTEAMDTTINRMRTTSPEEKRSSDTEAWRGWVDKYLERVGREEKEEEGGTSAEERHRRRVAAMRAVNPSFILRSWIAQDAIEAAEKKDFSRVRAVLAQLQNPFQTQPGVDESLTARYCTAKPPEWADSVYCTCSS